MVLVGVLNGQMLLETQISIGAGSLRWGLPHGEVGRRNLDLFRRDHSTEQEFHKE